MLDSIPTQPSGVSEPDKSTGATPFGDKATSEQAGQLAPFTLLIVNILLHGLRYVFGEVVTAFPYNGGAYSALLNTTSKFAAALGAVLTFLDGLSLSVVSSASGVGYLQTLVPDLPLVPVATAVIAVFGVLLMWGLRDSATVALAIFSCHFVTLCILIVSSVVYLARDGGQTLAENWGQGFADIVSHSGDVFTGNVGTAIFFGVSQGFLGVTGFETTANYVEELKPGMFTKTMRDMWCLVMFFNPIVTLLSLSVLPIDFIREHPNDMLVYVANKSAGPWLGKLLAVDAAIVLAGGVLTAYVAGIGVMKRLALDRCLPQFLLIENKWRRTNHILIFVFMALALSLLWALNGDLYVLTLVLDMSFLGVMGTFVLSCVLLKLRRHTIRRDQFATATHILLGTAFAVWGFTGIIMLSTEVLQYFVLYFVCTAAVIFFTMHKSLILRILTRVTPNWFRCIHRKLARDVAAGKMESALYFCKTPDMYLINKGILYLRANESATRIVVVHVHNGNNQQVVDTFSQNAQMVNGLYPKLSVVAITIEGEFGPSCVQFMSQEFDIPDNMMFIGCPSSHFQHPLHELGLVRVVTRYIPVQVSEDASISVQTRENTFSFSSFDEAALKAFHEQAFPRHI